MGVTSVARGPFSLTGLMLACIAFSFSLAIAKPMPTKERNWDVRWQPTRVVNGAPMLLKVQPFTDLKSLTGMWMGHDVYFSRPRGSETWYGLAGVSLETTPGRYPLTLEAITGGGEKLSIERTITVSKARYPTIAVKVAKKFTEPDPEQLKQIAADKSTKEQTFKHFEPERLWSGDFEPPVKARVSDLFGTGRTFNGKVQSRHQGLDYAVPAGTPIDAVNRGTVLLARPLYFEGNCVVLDHGQGLLTLYMHLSEIKVKEGETVSRGEEVGLSGGTGRATGPHLHIAIRWQGIYLDPAILMKLRLP
jgi:murein DD-endopeptidase MepM/ murein hydrolase activator NlpD